MNTATGGTSKDGNTLYVNVKPFDPCPGCPQGAVCKTPECGRLQSTGWVEGSYVPQPELRVAEPAFWVAEAVTKGGGIMYVTAPHERYPFSVTETADIQTALRFFDAESCQRFIDWQYRDVAPASRPIARGLQVVVP